MYAWLARPSYSNNLAKSSAGILVKTFQKPSTLLAYLQTVWSSLLWYIHCTYCHTHTHTSVNSHIHHFDYPQILHKLWNLADISEHLTIRGVIYHKTGARTYWERLAKKARNELWADAVKSNKHTKGSILHCIDPFALFACILNKRTFDPSLKCNN